MPAPQENVEIVDPRHPLFGRTLPCLGIANSSHQGQCCIVWIRPTVERHVPIAATTLEFDPTTLFPLPITVESLQQLLQEFLLVFGDWKGDLTNDDSTSPIGRAEGNPSPPDPTDRRLGNAHARATNERSSRDCPHVSGMSSFSPGGHS